MKLIFPKSVRESQRIVVWAFPVLIGYGVVSLVFAASTIAIIAIAVGILVVLTGWLSFGSMHEDIYNDVLLSVDLSLLAVYFLLLHYASFLNYGPNLYYVTIWNLSGSAFFLYSVWDCIALAGRDTSAIATACHLRRFALICFIFGVAFFALGWLMTTGVPQDAFEELCCRILGLIIWIAVLVFWHIGRLQAAISDARQIK